MTRLLSGLALVPLLLAGDRQPPGPVPGQPGPWDQDVLVHRVSKSGAVETLATFERSGVPTVARLTDGRLIAATQHFPENDPASFDKVAVRFSRDEGRTWTLPRGIWRATSPDGANWTLLDDWRVPGADPGAVATRDGAWLVVSTGPPRPGTPSALRLRPGRRERQSHGARRGRY